MIKRLSDIFFAFFGLILLLPFFILICLLVGLTSKGPVFYLQKRVGRFNKDFKLIKFRTMFPYADTKSALTIGGRDPRITQVGYYLRKYKIDELPQLINVLMGDMSIVGPRPEVRKYVEMYSEAQKEVLSIRPGITDYASLQYFSESELLAASDNPEETYINEIMPAKLLLNKKYLKEHGFFTDLKLILDTIRRIFNKTSELGK
jgi:lipopolysaccharide/colanic/teichoic acid biosynthesis glycosyltransferase